MLACPKSELMGRSDVWLERPGLSCRVGLLGQLAQSLVDWPSGGVGVVSTCRFPFGRFLVPSLWGSVQISLLSLACHTLPLRESEKCLASDCSSALTPETGWEAGQIELLTPPAVVLWALCCGHCLRNHCTPFFGSSMSSVLAL